MRSANVYFLPAATAPAEPPRVSTWRRLRAHLRAECWRLRFAIAGFRMALRRPRATVIGDDSSLAFYGDHRAQLIERRPRLTPARIIDFGSARERLRPLAAAR
jgi:hypothetical protein